ncbi:cyclic nucleotide-binding protein [Flavonifractor sp. An135]|nr:Crp/Fnr family transcriptional regulator [Flavonifractor sp. An135]OUQ20636.1 cyclic nucleotide-binding protein [Flavonifractor sp. An135]
MNDTWTPLAEGQPVLHYAPGQFIYLQDTQADRFYYIVSGTVKCFLSAESGEERTLTLLRAGELIGEAAFFDKQPRMSSAVAVTKCELVEVDHARLAQVFRLHPELAIAMLENLARRVRLLSGHVDGAFLQADQRVARHLLSLTPGEDGAIPCTHEDIGASVGVSRVTVSRVLSRFAHNGWLRTGYRSVELLDRKALESLCEEER